MTREKESFETLTCFNFDDSDFDLNLIDSGESGENDVKNFVKSDHENDERVFMKSDDDDEDSDSVIISTFISF